MAASPEGEAKTLYVFSPDGGLLCRVMEKLLGRALRAPPALTAPAQPPQGFPTHCLGPGPHFSPPRQGWSPDPLPFPAMGPAEPAPAQPQPVLVPREVPDAQLCVAPSLPCSLAGTVGQALGGGGALGYLDVLLLREAHHSAKRCAPPDKMDK